MPPVQLPPAVRRSPSGSLIPVIGDNDLTLYVREDVFDLKKYPRECPGELRMGTWQIDRSLLVVLILRLARSDAATFDCPLDVGNAQGVRILQCLASQNSIDVFIVTDRVVRSLRLPNPLRAFAGKLVKRLHNRTAWSPEEWHTALARLNQLYPTAVALWRSLEQVVRR